MEANRESSSHMTTRSMRKRWSATPTGLLGPGEYFWRAQTRLDQQSEESAWSEIGNFAVFDSYAAMTEDEIAEASPYEPSFGGCSHITAYHIFQKGNASATGTQNKIQFRSRRLGDCSGEDFGTGESVTWSMAHVRVGGANTDDAVEIGWYTYFDANDVRRHRVFTARILNGFEDSTDFNPSPSTCLNAGESDVYRVKHLSSTNNNHTWGLYINCLDGVGWRHLKSYSALTAGTGVVMGEIGKASSEEIHSADVQRDLRRGTSDGAWVAWSSNQCHLDNMPQWKPISLQMTAIT
jgi:hypothetical protein